jgi:hypothetical protein
MAFGASSSNCEQLLSPQRMIETKAASKNLFFIFLVKV